MPKLTRHDAVHAGPSVVVAVGLTLERGDLYDAGGASREQRRGENKNRANRDAFMGRFFRQTLPKE